MSNYHCVIEKPIGNCPEYRNAYCQCYYVHMICCSRGLEFIPCYFSFRFLYSIIIDSLCQTAVSFSFNNYGFVCGRNKANCGRNMTSCCINTTACLILATTCLIPATNETVVIERKSNSRLT